MITSDDYLTEDIEKFMEVHRVEYEKPQNESVRKLLSVQDKISFFKNIDPLELKAIVYDVKFKKYKYKDYIVEEGSYSNEIFFIIQGECQVYHNNKKVGKLHPGEIFGEAGAIFRTRRNATVVCSSKEAKLLSFCIDEENMKFCSVALATLYKNLASEINAKLEDVNNLCNTKSPHNYLS